VSDDFFRLPLGQWVKVAVDWVTENLGFVFDFIRSIFGGLYDAADWLFITPPFWAVIVVLAGLSLWLRGWKFGVGVAIGLLLILFRVGVVPGIVATIIFSMAPGVRLTELGIRGVDAEVVEAGFAFGASPRRILRQIQLPLAAPTIMAGVNQVIMLSLSMVVIAGMVGAGGLGAPIVQALSRIDVGLGFEAGLAVVILAILLDRLTASLGTRRRGPHKPSARVRAAEENSPENAEAMPAPASTV
jgi:ABC-type proline/glycine betaine transport system permease subunit